MNCGQLESHSVVDCFHLERNNFLGAMLVLEAFQFL